MLPDEDFIRELTRTVWTTVLGLEAGDAASFAEPLEHEITTSVDISGGWDGTVSISFSGALGRRLAAAMFQCPEDEATPGLITDAVGELANVIGGNVKAMVPGPSKLSLPRVDTSAAPGDSAQDGERLWFDCEGSPFSVSVRPTSLPTEGAP
jgi:chemotaxis protein CheX